MRIIFCGTPDYAVPSLEALVASGKHEVVAVVSQPDQPKGRSRTPTPPPVVEAALKLGIARDKIFQPKSINKKEILESLRALSPDVLCVIAYGNLLKKSALGLARLHPLNAHGSLLPRHRGAAPIQAAILAGDAETGVSIMKMELGLDTGPFMLKQSIPIEPRDDAGTLHDKLAALSARCFVEALDQLAAGPVTFTPQDESLATYAAKLEKDSGRIDWTKDAAYLERFIRAMNPWPGAWTSTSSRDGAAKIRLRVVKAELSSVALPAGSGKVEADAFIVGGGTGALKITEIQPEGKRPMSVAEFLRGAGKKLAGESRWA